MLACCWLDEGASLARARAAGVTEESFYFPAARELWRLSCALVDRGVVLMLETVAEELKAERKLEAVGGFAYLMQVTGKIPSTAHVGYFIEKLREKENLRRLVREGSAMVESAYAYTGGGLDIYGPVVSARAAIEEVQAKSGRELPPILTWSTFVGEKPREKPPELIKGVLHRGSKMMLAGGSKSFKTWVLLDLGLSVATGTPWWGKATVRGRVLYLNMELPVEFCEDRVRQISEAKHIQIAEGFDSWHLRGFARDFRELLPHILRRVAGGQYSLVILDPVYKVLGEVDENNNGEVAQLLNEIEAMTVKLGSAVAYGHHHSKGNQSEKDAKDRSSGAGAWTRDPDALIDLTPHEEEEHFVATFTLRNMPPQVPMVVEWKFPCMSVAPGLDPAALRKPGRRIEHTMESALVCLMGKPEGLSHGEWEELALKKGMSESTFKRLIKKAVTELKVTKGFGKYVLATSKTDQK